MEGATVGRYQVIQRLATGGTCEILLARAHGPRGFGRDVVLKRLLSSHRSDPQLARLLSREAAAYARLDHPAIVRLYDFFEDRDNEPVLALEWVNGVTLTRLVSQCRARGLTLPVSAVMFIGSCVFAALSAAHGAKDPETLDAAPVIHRDINPANILCARSGFVKVADFGIAMVDGESDTPWGTIKGTYGYMAPEQATCGHVTMRTDVYSAALVMWELFTGRRAFDVDALSELELLRRVAHPQLPSLDALCPELPARVRHAMGAALSPDPSARHISAAAMFDVFHDAVHGESGRAQIAKLVDAVDHPATASADETIRTAPLFPPSDPRMPVTPPPFTRSLDEAPTLTPTTDDRTPAPPQEATRASWLGILATAACVAAAAVLAAPHVYHRVKPGGACNDVSSCEPARRPSSDTTPSADVPASSVPVMNATRPAPIVFNALGNVTTPSASASPPSPPAVPPDVALLSTERLRPFHRIIVDGKTLGETPAVVSVPCGRHVIRIGSAGTPREIDARCGERLDLRDE